MWGDRLKREIREAIRGSVLFDVPMDRYTSFRVGGPADAMAFPLDVKDLETLLNIVRKQGIPYFIMGRGTNLLVRDGGIRGLVVNLSSGMTEIHVTGEKIRAGAGALLSQMIGIAMKQGLAGLAPLYGIPGSVGGGLAMNAGAWGTTVGDRIESIALMNGSGRTRRILREDLDFRYRELLLPQGAIIVEGTFLMERREKERIQKEMALFHRKRRETQPVQYPSAGSVFKNPPGVSAGEIIEELGLKGKRVGGAEVSRIHGNFILNTGNATADHVLELIHLIQERAFRERGLTLEPEVRIVGE